MVEKPHFPASTKEINKCLDFVAPYRERKVKQKKCTLPKEVQDAIKRRKDLQKKHQTNVEQGKVDFEVHKNF